MHMLIQVLLVYPINGTQDTAPWILSCIAIVKDLSELWWMEGEEFEGSRFGSDQTVR